MEGGGPWGAALLWSSLAVFFGGHEGSMGCYSAHLRPKAMETLKPGAKANLPFPQTSLLMTNTAGILFSGKSAPKTDEGSYVVLRLGWGYSETACPELCAAQPVLSAIARAVSREEQGFCLSR